MSTPPMGYPNDSGSCGSPDPTHSSGSSVNYDPNTLPYYAMNFPGQSNPNAYHEHFSFPGNNAISRVPDPSAMYSMPSMVSCLVPSSRLYIAETRLGPRHQGSTGASGASQRPNVFREVSGLRKENARLLEENKRLDAEARTWR